MGHHLSNQAQMFSGLLEALWVVWLQYCTVYVQWTRREDLILVDASTGGVCPFGLIAA